MSVLLGIAERLLTASHRPESLRRRSSGLTRLVNAVDARIRTLEAQGQVFPQIQSFDGTKLISCVRQSPALWSSATLVPCETPGMLSSEECQYYTYIGQFFSGIGEVVELGPWLGRSTFYIVQGLSKNPRFAGKKISVYDDFVWRSTWMDSQVSESERVQHHGDFEFLFKKYTRGIEDSINAYKRKIITYDGNGSVEQLVWDARPIEIMYVDCGRTMEANEAWWVLFSNCFIPEKTLVILQDWSTHREVPVQWYNQMKEWVESKGRSLQLMHELERGDIATFLYKG